jgi:hypothetical protein
VIKDQVIDEPVERAVSRGLVLELVDPVLGRGQRHRFYAVRPAHAARPGADVVRSWGALVRPRAAALSARMSGTSWASGPSELWWLVWTAGGATTSAAPVSPSFNG